MDDAGVKLVHDAFYVVDPDDGTPIQVGQWYDLEGRRGWYVCGSEERFRPEDFRAVRRVRL